jgi:membrane associated rhomboid family serine protease
LLQVWLGFGSIGQLGGRGGIAYLAHVGGAATGIFVAFLFRDRARQLQARNDDCDGWFMGP